MAKRKMPWLRVYTEMIDDEKLRILAFEDRWHFVAILCCKRAGMLDAGDTPKMLCKKMAIKLGLHGNELELVASRLAEVGLIDEKTFQPVAWDERQFDSDSDPTATARKRKQRAKIANVTDKSRGTVTNVTRTDTDTDTERARAIERQVARKTASRFDEFWNAYPVKKGKADSEKKWRLHNLDAIADRIIADVKMRVASDRDWLDGYAPHGSTYVNGRGWEDGIKPMKGAAGTASMFDGAI